MAEQIRAMRTITMAMPAIAPVEMPLELLAGEDAVEGLEGLVDVGLEGLAVPGFPMIGTM